MGTSTTRRPVRTVLLLVAVLGLGVLVPVRAEEGPPPAPRPMVFVHGFMGSASQFESQGMRLTSNGYPLEYITAFEYDSMGLSTGGAAAMAEVHDRLDDHIDAVLADTGADAVDLLGHSMGTGVSLGYLASPARAERVAHYVNLDGSSTAPGAPDGVPTLAVWSLNNPTAELPGATNLHLPDQGHTEVVGSEESFAEIFAFLTGAPPATTAILAQPDEEVMLSGRVTLFPENVGAAGATLEIHEIDPDTGARLEEVPAATYELDERGDWGPFDADAHRVYEYLVSRVDGTHHIYRSPSPRTNHLIRLQTSEPDGLVAGLTDNAPDHTNLTISRDQEWWGDQGEGSDRIEVAGHEILNSATAPRNQSIIGIFVFDAGADGESDLSRPVGIFALLPFLTGVDLHLPGANPPDGTIEVRAEARGTDHVERFVVPNHASEDEQGQVRFVSVHFADHHQSFPDQPDRVACPEVLDHPFVDLASGSVHADAVACAADLGLANGVTPTTFVPAAATTRGQLASFLARTLQAAGHVLPDPGAPFSDVPAGHAHADAIGRLAAAGIVKGRSAERFDPATAVTRAQTASFVTRSLAWASGTEPAGPPVAFADRDAIPSAHLAAVDAAVANGLLHGRASNRFDPHGATRRDQAASVVVRLLDRL